MDTNAITHVSLCSGYGGIDLGLKRAIGRSLRTVAYVEVESFAVANLVAKASQELLDEAPVWSDLRSFPWGKFHGLVDILSGGYPCQPFSAAGKRLGAEDPRHLWPHISAGIAVMRPAVCFFENVEGHISLGLPDVIEDLARLGYRTTWGIFSASEVGAPHQRKRVFILACDQRQRIEELHRIVAMGPQQHPAGNISSGWRRVSFAADCNGYDEETGELGSECSICGCDYTDDCECPGPTQDGYEYAEFDGVLYARPEQAWPSRPGEQQLAWEPPRVVADILRKQSQRGRNAGELGSAASAEQGEAQQWKRCGNSAGNQGEAGAGPEDIWRRRSGESGERQAQPPLGRDADGPADWLDDAELFTTCDNRTDELRLLGNGVVPATAERAFRVLVGELMEHQP